MAQAKKVDRPSKEADKLTKLTFKGKEGKEFRRNVVDFLRNVTPLTEAYTSGRDLLPQLGGLLQSAIGQQQAILPTATDVVNRGLRGQFFDIGPWQDYVQRQLQRQTAPSLAQSFAGLNVPMSSDFTGQLIGANRDAYTDLAARGALMNFEAQNALINQGGLGNFFNTLQQPANIAMQGANQLLGTDLLARQVEKSAEPGAAPLFQSFLQGGLEPLSVISSRGRATQEVEGGGGGGGLGAGLSQIV